MVCLPLIAQRALPIASDLASDVMRLVDEATPLVTDTPTAQRVALQRETFLRLESSSQQARAARSPPAAATLAAPNPPRSASNEKLVGWLRTLHALVLVCAQSLQTEREGGEGGGEGGEKMREPQSVQSLPYSHAANSDPGPPSSQRLSVV